MPVERKFDKLQYMNIAHTIYALKRQQRSLLSWKDVHAIIGKCKKQILQQYICNYLILILNGYTQNNVGRYITY